MLDGKTLKRTMSAPSFIIYLDRIAKDFGFDAGRKAIGAVRSHVDYYGSLGKGNLRSVAAACDAVEAKLI